MLQVHTSYTGGISRLCQGNASGKHKLYRWDQSIVSRSCFRYTQTIQVRSVECGKVILLVNTNYCMMGNSAWVFFCCFLLFDFCCCSMRVWCCCFFHVCLFACRLCSKLTFSKQSFIEMPSEFKCQIVRFQNPNRPATSQMNDSLIFFR